jgi:short-subunit dehydrogenase
LAVVTGASSGIGYELAREIGQRGFDVMIAAEDDGIERAAENLKQLGIEARPIKANLATYEGVERLVSEALAVGRPIEAVAINAGVGVSGDFARQTDLKDELSLVDLNVSSAVHLAKRLLGEMVRRRRGRLLFTSSVASAMPAPFEATYGASKAFLLSFAEALGEELRDSGVTVTALLPGPTATNFFRRAGMEETRVGKGKKDPAAEVAHQGVEAMFSGKSKIVAGSIKNDFQVLASHILPDSVKARLHRRMLERQPQQRQ